MDASAPPRQLQRRGSGAFVLSFLSFWAPLLQTWSTHRPFSPFCRPLGASVSVLQQSSCSAALVLKHCEQKGMRLLCFSGQPCASAERSHAKNTRSTRLVVLSLSLMPAAHCSLTAQFPPALCVSANRHYMQQLPLVKAAGCAKKPVLATALLPSSQSCHKAEVRRSFITTTVREQHPRSHHKGATGRVRTGDQRYPVLCHCQLGQDIPRIAFAVSCGLGKNSLCCVLWPWRGDAAVKAALSNAGPLLKTFKQLR